MASDETNANDSSPQRVGKGLKRFLTIGLDVSGRACLVVGGGRVGARRALLLADGGGEVTVLSPELSDPLRGAVAAGRIHWRRGKYTSESLKGFYMVIAATPDPDLNLQIGRDAEACDILFCVTSAGRASRVIFPAIHEHEGVTIAVHSHGQTPQRSIRIRDTIAQMLSGERYSDRHPCSSARQTDGSSLVPGKVYIIGAGPGAPDLITVRGLEAILSANVIIYDRILGQAFLEQLGVPAMDKAVRWLGAGERGPERQAEINEKMLEAVRAGKIVARVKNGDPFVFGRGAEEVQFLKDQGIPWEVIPGLESATSVLSAAGYPLTCRAKGRSFAVTSARRAGGAFNEVYPKADSLVVLMGIDVLDRVAARLLEDGWPADTPAVVIERGTLPGEKRVTGTLQTIAELAARARVASPALLAAGDVAAGALS